MTAGELRGVMQDIGLSYEETAEIVGVTKSGVNKWLYDSKPIMNVGAVTLLRMLRTDLALIQKIREARSTPGSEAAPRKMGAAKR